jgi:hypothetical protein
LNFIMLWHWHWQLAYNSTNLPNLSIIFPSFLHNTLYMRYFVAYTKTHDCANVIWSLKGIENPHLSTLVTFFRQKVSITLQRMQTSFVLSQVVTIGLTIPHPVKTHLPSPWPIYCKPSIFDI